MILETYINENKLLEVNNIEINKYTNYLLENNFTDKLKEIGTKIKDTIVKIINTIISGIKWVINNTVIRFYNWIKKLRKKRKEKRNRFNKEMDELNDYISSSVKDTENRYNTYVKELKAKTSANTEIPIMSELNSIMNRMKNGSDYNPTKEYIRREKNEEETNTVYKTINLKELISIPNIQGIQDVIDDIISKNKDINFTENKIDYILNKSGFIKEVNYQTMFIFGNICNKINFNDDLDFINDPYLINKKIDEYGKYIADNYYNCIIRITNDDVARYKTKEELSDYINQLEEANDEALKSVTDKLKETGKVLNKAISLLKEMKSDITVVDKITTDTGKQAYSKRITVYLNAINKSIQFTNGILNKNQILIMKTM